MSWTHVQGAQVGAISTTTVASLTASFASSVTPGNRVVVGAISFSSTPGRDMTCADNKTGNTYGSDVSLGYIPFSGHYDYLHIFSSVIVQGGTGFNITITTLVSTTYFYISIDEFSFSGTSSVDNTTTNTGTPTGSATYTAGNMTGLAGDDLIVMLVENENVSTTPTWVPGASFNLAYNNTNTSGATAATSYWTGNTNSSCNPTMTGLFGGTTGLWGAVGVAYKNVGGASPSLFMPPTLSLGIGGSFFQTPVNG